MNPADNPINALNEQVKESEGLTKSDIYTMTNSEHHSLLRAKMEPVDIKQLIANLNGTFPEVAMTTMEKAIEFVSNEENGAAGLAAPQVGSWGCWFVMKLGREAKATLVINPDIIARSGRKQHIEGCFSEPLKAQVKRSREITVNYFTIQQDDEGKWNSEYHERINLSGWDAQVFQHEYDHLRGILICEKKGSKVIFDG